MASLVVGVSFERLERGSLDDGNIITGELVLAEEVADLHLDEVEKLLVIDLVGLVEEDNHGGDPDLTGEQDVLTGLGHGAIGGADHENGSVHLGGNR